MNRVKYKTDDLCLLRTFNNDEMMSAIDIHECSNNEDVFLNFMSDIGAPQIGEKLKSSEYIAYSPEMLDGVIKNSALGVDKIYYLSGNFDIPDLSLQYIKSLVENHNVQVITKKINFVLIATDGQYNYQSRKAVGESWTIAIAADNNDLFAEHVHDSARLDGFHLVIPKTASSVKGAISLNIQKQMQIDSQRFLNSVNGYVSLLNNSKKTGVGSISKLDVCDGMVSVYA
ncbi:MAG: hypothetical protein RPS47_04750 [Colwellia sp.]